MLPYFRIRQGTNPSGEGILVLVQSECLLEPKNLVFALLQGCRNSSASDAITRTAY